MLEPRQARNLSAHPAISHAFFSRRGGASSGIFASLNCSLSQDLRAPVLENRRRVARHLKSRDDHLYVPSLCHSSRAVFVDDATAAATEADAVVTTCPNLAIAVLGADCAPVLLADPVARVVAAAHAGWRGAQNGVLDSAVHLMEKHGAQVSRIVAAVGPCIHQKWYEVSGEFQDTFLSDAPTNARFFVTPEPGARPHFDLPAYVVDRLQRLGIQDVEDLDVCTRNDEEFFSYRRSVAEGVKGFGCQASGIMLS